LHPPEQLLLHLGLSAFILFSFPVNPLLQKHKLLFFFFLAVLELELRVLTLARQALYHLSHSISPFWVGFFQTICLGWLQTSTLLISAS
jgi:hypothetical protein